VTERIARRIALAVLSRIEEGRLTIVEGATRTTFGSDAAPAAIVKIRDPRAWTKLLQGSRGMAEAYRDNYWDSPDLVAVIRVGARNARRLDAVRRRATPIREPFQRARQAFRSNTPRRARRDIEAHYDLGNELFALMLDDTMMYSSAVFATPQTSLHEAAVAKLDMICDKLALGPDDHVLEIGTGWGGFAAHAAATRGCRVTTTTISAEQHAHAVERVNALGLRDRVTVLQQDYRDLEGRYDKLVSIEMIEAVGWKDFPTFFRACSDLLEDDGAMLLQAIVMDDRAYAVERASRSFIRTLIFPNGCLPSREVIARCVARDTDLHTTHLEDLTPHYAETLHRWRANFDGAEEKLRGLGYDDAFQRLWRLYLAYCEAGFAERRIGLVQTVLAKPRWRPEACEQQHGVGELAAVAQ
jgi:cyclopropane-fatty-acyl-phospholipid synthase